MANPKPFSLTPGAGRRAVKSLPPLALICALAACSQPLDLDLRGKMGSPFDTSKAANEARKSAARPAPDARGVISYPTYQMAVARRGDTVASVAARVGVDAAELARYNATTPDASLRKGAVLALPQRVAAKPAQSPAGSAVISPPAGGVDITSIAGTAIDNASPTPVTSAALPAATVPPPAQEPIRHKIERGETAYTIARLYGVSVRSLAEWNGLDQNYSIQEGRYLMIPVPDQPAPANARNAAGSSSKPAGALAGRDTSTTSPGAGSPTPTPPSSTKPLPDKDSTPVASKPPADIPSPNLGNNQSKSRNTAQMLRPVSGRIIRDYAKGKNEGIDIAAAPGTSVKAAQNGTVAAITSDADQVPIIVVKHANNLLTVYANVGNIAVKKGQSVKRGQSLAKIRGGDSAYLHFEVRKGFDSVDPTPYIGG